MVSIRILPSFGGGIGEFGADLYGYKVVTVWKSLDNRLPIQMTWMTKLLSILTLHMILLRKMYGISCSPTSTVPRLLRNHV